MWAQSTAMTSADCVPGHRRATHSRGSDRPFRTGEP
jgi:hypothetical protein